MERSQDGFATAGEGDGNASELWRGEPVSFFFVGGIDSAGKKTSMEEDANYLVNCRVLVPTDVSAGARACARLFGGGREGVKVVGQEGFELPPRDAKACESFDSLEKKRKHQGHVVGRGLACC